MKVTFVLVGLLAVVGIALAKPNSVELEAVPYEQRAFEGVIEGIINTVKDILAPHDPLHKDVIEQSILGHNIQISNLNAEGFSNFFPSRLSLGGLITWTLDLELTIPKVTASVENWKVDGSLFYGDGAAHAIIENFKVRIVAKISVLSISLKSVQVTPSMGNADVSITGVYNNEEKSQEITDKINHFLNDTLNNDKDFHKLISDLLFDLISKILESIF